MEPASAIWHNVAMADSARRIRPRDMNQLTKLVTDIATGAVEDRENRDEGKNPHAVTLGRLGGPERGVGPQEGTYA